ncbi:D-alanine--D-alanine ligase [Pseudomarimonas arenosa]|uniref:D-alanine--D-alanine ligase n=1 Tax=Pseudomarimonas arenosa TaxID=2774145 RepID=A0AAW3ZI45_9GAMM|nr:D-alanine--D-alanine ligase [Pseudomarimonas arenosa]MBD8525458.1 D-alanine--D-alanine ligase [Pseudomarimonas arenosa]
MTAHSQDVRQLFGRVAVLLGGSSSEREVSLDSGRNVLESLVAAGVDARPIDGVPALIKELQAGTVDRVFNILHGSRGGGEDGVLQGLLEAYGIPCTGSDVLGSALAMDKVRSKQVWQSLGLSTAEFCVLRPGEDLQEKAEALGYPLIVKPACEGSSVGISRVFKPEDLAAAVALAKRYPGELLLERLIVGDELTVGILGEQALPSIRIVPAGEYYDYHAKYVAEDTQYICPGLRQQDDAELGELALAAFRAVGCRGWGRVDVMRDRSGRNYLLEVNTAPGMTSHSLVPKAASQLGIDFSELCLRILRQTLAAVAAP